MVLTHARALLTSNKVAEPLLSNPPRVASYPQGSWGPDQARKLIAPGRWLLGQ